MSDLEYLQPNHGGISSGTPTRIFASETIRTDNVRPAVMPASEPRRTDNFRSSGSIITVSENGTVKSPSILPLVFGAGMALFIVYNAQKAGFGNFSFNFR
jgi:hypothetical protein